MILVCNNNNIIQSIQVGIHSELYLNLFLNCITESVKSTSVASFHNTTSNTGWLFGTFSDAVRCVKTLWADIIYQILKSPSSVRHSSHFIEPTKQII